MSQNKKAKKISKNSQRNYTTIVISVVAVFFIIAGILYQKHNDKTEPAKPMENVDIPANQKAELPTDKKVIGITKEKPYQTPYINPPPAVSATAYAVINRKDKVRMYAKNPDIALPPASLTKIMTALIALDRYNLNDPVVIPEKCVGLNASTVGFQSFDVFTVEDLLYGLLVNSGADSACAIANIEGEDKFVSLMNEKAHELKLENTSYENEIGFDASDSQLSSINDIITLSNEALKFKTFQIIVGTDKKDIQSLNSKKIYHLKNTNDLLEIPGAVGIKTGYTENAGQCLDFLYENKDEEILIVVLGSKDRFADTKTLLHWAQEQIKLIKKEKQQTNLGG